MERASKRKLVAVQGGHVLATHKQCPFLGQAHAPSDKKNPTVIKLLMEHEVLIFFLQLTYIRILNFRAYCCTCFAHILVSRQPSAAINKINITTQGKIQH